VDRSAYLKYLSALFLKGHRYSLRFQNKYKSDRSQNLTMSPDLSDLTIVITTFQERFAVFTVPLLETIRRVSEVPVIVVINGNLNSLTDSTKLSSFLKEISHHNQIYPVAFQSFQGCAKMWNTGVIHSRTSNILILNDDVSIVSEYFNSDLTQALKMLPKTGVLTFNSSWSHFLISRETTSNIGWFEERFIGIGNEDGEYAERYTKMTGENIPTINADVFINISDKSRDENVASTESKYSLFNSIYNVVRHENPELRFTTNPYPLNKWRDSMLKLLSEEDEQLVKESIRMELKET
jgi:predicted glycosyltransferase involved in capsule biosynthesis